MTRNFGALSIISMVASMVSALLLIWFILNPYDTQLVFFATGIMGFIGTITGFIARRSGAHISNGIGLYLGLIMVAAFILLLFYLTSTPVEPTRPQ